MTWLRRGLPLLFALALLVPATALAGVHVLFDPSSPAGGPFPSDLFSERDHSHLTGLRVNLPKPDCAARPSDCADIDVLNTLDGFNLQPRITIPFSGPIDPATVSSETVFLVSLGSTVHGGRGGKVIGINQIVWDTATNTLIAESDELLDQHTRYLLVVTDGVRDASGKRIREGDIDFDDDDHHHGWFHRWRRHCPPSYVEELERAVDDLHHGHGRRVVAASLFTTQSATAVLEKVRRAIKRADPAPATMLGTFPLSSLTGIQWMRQVGTAPTFSTTPLPLAALNVAPGAVSALAFGKFTSPDYETADKYIPAVGTRTGVPAVQGTNDIYFNLVLPSGTPPAGGWPVVIFGHGFTDSKHGAPLAVASTLAAHGLATIAINVVGHGGGSAGTLNIVPITGPPVIIPDGGRGIDQDGNGTIDSTEGANAAPPRGLIGNRDALRQTVIDIMQLVRVIETGGAPGLDPQRIYYAGQSFGGIYGTILLAVEPSLRAGVPNVPGGAIIEIARLSPLFRPLISVALVSRIPILSNGGPGGIPALGIPGFTESVPLRDQPTLIGTAPGALPIQVVLDHTEWASQSGNPVAYAPHLRKKPLHGVDPGPVIIQFAKGDQTVPNPTASALIRAGDLADRATFFRNDLVRLAIPSAPANPHTFLTNITTTAALQAIAAQTQIAIFFESDGAIVVDPDGPGTFFETPVVLPLPETLNF